MGMSSWTVGTPTVRFTTACIDLIYCSLQYRPYFEQFTNQFILVFLQIFNLFFVFGS